MNGWKLGFSLGVLIVVCAVAVMAFIDRSHAPTKTDGRELEPTPEQPDAPLTEADLRKRFGGITITQAGGIAGIQDVVTVDADLRATFTSRTGTRQVTLDAAAKRELLRTAADLADAGDFEAPETEPYPDQMSTTIELVWDGEQISSDPSSDAARPVRDVFENLRQRTTA